ncbi:TM216-like protein, partial [Mya arenaria]
MAATQAPKANRGQVQRSSLPYEVLLYLNGWYFGLFFVCEILLFAYKGENFPYASGVLPAEIILTYVTRADVILAAIQLAFIGLQLVFGIISIITFA